MDKLWFLFGLSILVAAPAHAAGERDRTGRLIDAFKAVRVAAEGGKLGEAEVKANDAAFAALDGFFDYEAFTTACIGPSAAKLSPPQQADVKKRLRDLFRKKGYPAGGGFFAKGTATLGAIAQKDGLATVPVKVHIAKEDLTTELVFAFSKDGKVVDLGIDGDWLARDYQNQIAKVIAKGGPDELLKRLARQ